MSGYVFQTLDILGTLSFFEKCVELILKAIGYGFGSLCLLHRFGAGGLSDSDQITMAQSISYVENGEKIYRRADNMEYFLSTFQNFTNLVDLINDSFVRHAKLPCFGSRQTISRVVQESSVKGSRPIVKYNLSDYNWKTYGQVHTEIKAIANYFLSIGMKGKKIAIFADSSDEWMSSALAAITVHATVVTVYSSLSNESIEYALKLTNPDAILVDFNTISRVHSILPNIPSIKTVICSSKGTDDNKYYMRYVINGITFIHYNDIVTNPTSYNLLENFNEKPDSSHAIVIMFTSGSTGTPKGVVISHKNIIAIIKSAETLDIVNGLIYPGYLPLAHILEFGVETTVLAYGKPIGYCSALTLTDSSPGLAEECKGDLTLLKPTCFSAVPLIMERIMKAVMNKLKSESRLKQLIFQTAYNIRAYYLGKGYDTPIINRLIFQKLRNALGGKVRIGLYGGSAINKFTDEWFQVCFGPFKQCYGSTEVCCGGTIGNVKNFIPGNCGPPFSCSDIKLIPWEEGGYYPDDPSGPKGEILIHGEHVASHYYEQEELSNEVFRVDPVTGKRWFYTGDIGEILKDGTLKIIDRKKDITKLIHGEYISLGQIECCIGLSKYVEQCFVSPDTENEFLVSIIVPNRKIFEELSKSLKLAGEESLFEKMVENKKVTSILIDDISQITKQGNLNKFEIPKKYVIVSDEWTPDTGLVTATLKLRRVQLKQKYNKYLDLKNQP